jgi:phospholipid transport system substrate-binding protein
MDMTFLAVPKLQTKILKLKLLSSQHSLKRPCRRSWRLLSKPKRRDLRKAVTPARIILLVSLALCLLAPPLVSGGDTAVQVIDKLHAELLAVMKHADELGYTGRYQRLAPFVTSSYDLPFIARVVVGRHWKDFSDAQKSKFIDTFTRLSIGTYADRFAGYSGERFRTISNEESRRGRRLVKTELIKPDGEKIPLDYILHDKDNQWRIINVIAAGVSDLSLKRADYSSFLKREGFDALLVNLDNKIKQFGN